MTDDILLEIKDLKINFQLDEGIVRAVEGVKVALGQLNTCVFLMYGSTTVRGL